jgi:hypothetical protein
MSEDIDPTISDEESERILMNVKPLWEEWGEDPAEIAKRQTKIMRKDYPSKLIRENYKDAFNLACYRAELPKWQAGLFMSHLIEDITGQLISDKIVHIPRLALLGVVPISSANRFRVHFCADPALRLCVSEEINRPCENVVAFSERCHAMASALPSYRKRGTTYTSLTAHDRRLLGRERREYEEKRYWDFREFLAAKYAD